MKRTALTLGLAALAIVAIMMASRSRSFRRDDGRQARNSRSRSTTLFFHQILSRCLWAARSAQPIRMTFLTTL